MNTLYGSRSNTLFLNLEDYPGGTAAWGALPAVFDNVEDHFDKGVHIHARLEVGKKKVIDASFAEVIVHWRGKNQRLDEASAVAYTMSSIFDQKMVAMDCSCCGSPLLDQGISAVTPSFDHYCRFCGACNQTSDRVVINPIIQFKQWIGDEHVQRPVVLPERKIVLDAERFAGGFQIWGSNPSIIWTAPKLEESAIHVHAYNADGKRIVDNTYKEVWVGETPLDIQMIRVLQIQRAIVQANAYLDTAYCPDCDNPHFDTGTLATIPHKRHLCECCGHIFETHTLISNPMVAALRPLHQFNRSTAYVPV